MKNKIKQITFTLALLCSLCTECAYFNAYYNSETAFNAAYREHLKTMKNYTDSIPKPQGKALSNYDRAIAKAEKVLEVYPKDKDWLDASVFMIGKASFYKGDYPKAIRAFIELQSEYAGSKFIPASYLLLGQAYLYNDELQKAEDALMVVMDKYPFLNKNEDVSLLLARIAIKREGKSLALELLEKVKNSVRSDDKKIELILQMSQLYIDLKQYDKAIILLKSAPRKKNLPLHMYRIDYALVVCYLQKDSCESALALTNTMLKNKAYSHQKINILLKKGEILKRLHNIDDAITVYEEVTAGNDSSGVSGMAWYELALIYQHNKYDYAKAKECFDKAVALLRDDDIKKKAIGFSKSLALLDTLRQGRAKKDTTADSLLSPKLKWYKIGEMFWFDLQEPDSAYRRFMLLTKDTSLPEEMYPKTLYAAGWIALNALKDTVIADSLFDLLIDGYPDNAYSKRAQIDRGREVTIQTEEDLAWDAFKGAEQMYLDRDSMPAAVEAYLSVYKDYPECEAAPKSLYAAAWICDNMLAKNKTAKGLYEKLCAEYPQTEYCMQSAKPRLKVAMDTLTALRERSKQKSQENKDSRPVKPGENTKMQQRKNTKTPTSPPDSLTPVSSEDLTAAAPASKDTLVPKDTSVLKSTPVLKGAPALKDTSTTPSPAGSQGLRKK